jgi:hypothetical protein
MDEVVIPAQALSWNPLLATPSLVAGSAAIIADDLQAINFNRTVNVNNTTTLKQTVTGDQLMAAPW